MTRPSTVDEVVEALATHGGELRAGGTDVRARARGPFIDLQGVPALRGVTWRAGGAARLGAMTTIAEIVDDDRLRAAYPGLPLAAAELATPQIRAAATVGGNLLQRNRCWYYRNPHFSCHQTGGDTCPARTGVHLYSAVIDQGPCVAPHPSSLATVLLAYDATVEVHTRGTVALAELYGDGSDPTRDHTLADREVLLAVDLPAPATGERAAYQRVAARSGAEWPLVEAIARLVLSGTTITFAVVVAGGVARTPVRLTGVEAALVGRPATLPTLRAASTHATARCAPLAQTEYKVGLLRDTTLDVLERALSMTP
ncbi:oxidoreductase [Actinoplanes sp. ATCC 53533]|uniref:FAD binding domain-containing protein n=1 Tax=Actinoplanes sp. ATCC 53533 TaxID=1288362 RepID=UPI000F77B04E|nr:FAD binding domain-containing protein [Actinoplanes sp. ATCC 53533]RSM74244.1 oxidoreductase [Actinoplanes sp. ATCC 53533]